MTVFLAGTCTHLAGQRGSGRDQSKNVSPFLLFVLCRYDLRKYYSMSRQIILMLIMLLRYLFLYDEYLGNSGYKGIVNYKELWMVRIMHGTTDQQRILTGFIVGQDIL